MIALQRRPNTFPKSARLLKKKDFQFRPYRRFKTQYFHILYTAKGNGRLGISISKKILKNATARNRIRRLLREVFRVSLDRVGNLDIHVIGIDSLTQAWEDIKRQDIEREFETFFSGRALFPGE